MWRGFGFLVEWRILAVINPSHRMFQPMLNRQENLPLIQEMFEQAHGRFVSSPALLAAKLDKVKAFLFDWDGVFNTGAKSEQSGSPFAEPDSVGTNLMRYQSWLSLGRLPYMAIVTGENNQPAFKFAKREHFHGVFFGVKNKADAFAMICEQQQLAPEEVAFFFDDVLDMSVARLCGVRMMMRRQASPFFTRYVLDHGYCDYVTGQEGGFHGLREACELVLALRGNGREIFDSRIDFDQTYQRYLGEVQGQDTRFYSWQQGKIGEVQV